MRTSIKINDQYIQKILLGSTPVQRIYQSGSIVYEAGGSTPCFEVVDTISEASGDYVDVYAWDTEKWYKKNNISQFEEYGIMPTVDSLTGVTTYTGKLVILSTDSHEYKWNGSSWTDLGEISDVYTEYEYVQGNGTSYVYTDYIPVTNSRAEIDIQGRLASSASVTTGEASVFGSIHLINGAGSKRFTFMYPGYNTDGVAGGIRLELEAQQLASHDNDILSRGVVKIDKDHAYINDKLLATFNGSFTGNQGRVMIFTRSSYDPNTGTVTPAVLPYPGKIYNVKLYEGDTLVRNYVPAIKDGTVGFYETVNHVMWGSYVSTPFTVGGSSTEHGSVPEDYPTKVAPANNVHYNTLAELELMECPWIGMQATVGSNYIPYLYTATGWLKQYTPCFEVVGTISQASGDYVDVYALDTEKWYKRNNLNQYEEYGVMEHTDDLSELTYYTGKLVVLSTNNHEYKWNGTTWVDLGECEVESVLPNGYTQYQAIANNGNAYINTGYIPSNKTRILADMQITTSTTYGRLWGSGNWNVARSIQLDYEANTTGTIHGKWGTESTWNKNSNVRGDFNRHVYDMYDHYLYRDDELVLTFASGTFTSQHNLAIFTYYNYGTPGSSEWINGRLYSFKIYDNGTLVRDFIPCKRDSDSKVGAYDIVNNVFYPSSSSNQFSTYGDPYTPLTPVEEYDEKVAPADNVHYNTLAELEMMECPWIGMTATIGEDYTVYVYTEDGWVLGDLPLDLPYMRFTALEDTTFTFTKSSYAAQDLEIKYSIDGGVWNTMESGVATPTVPSGSYVVFKSNFKGGSGSPWGYNDNGIFSSTGNFSLSGNIMSLIYGDEFVGKTSLANYTNVFSYLFFNCTKLKSISDGLLPATTLANQCYDSMFSTCTGLTSIPSNLLPATTLADRCYKEMFTYCSGITSVPSGLLPATTLANQCYSGMFQSSGITSIPSGLLPATNLANSCYSSMFAYSNVNSIPADFLPATTLADYCYYRLFNRTKITFVPAGLLPATNLTDYCYQEMFSECKSLKSADIELPATTVNKTWVYNRMFYNCTNLLDTPIIKATSVSGNNPFGAMFYGCSKLNYLVCDMLNEPSSSISQDWLSGVAATGTFYKNPNATWDQTITQGTSTVPSGWNITTLSEPEYLKFTTLDDNGSTYQFTNPGLEYSIDGGAWTSLAANTNTPNVPKNSNIRFRGYLTPNGSQGIGTFSSSGSFKAEGDLMTLFYGKYYVGQTGKFANNMFRQLFQNATNLVDAYNIKIPYNIGKYNYSCYSMFSGCRNLEVAPKELKGDTYVGNRSFMQMFVNCVKLTKTPIIWYTFPAYDAMNCMFISDTLLNEVYLLQTNNGNHIDSLRSSSWLGNVAATGTFYVNKNLTWVDTIERSVSTIPAGWTIVKVDPNDY